MVEFIYTNNILIPSNLVPDFSLVLYNFRIRFDTNLAEIDIEKAKEKSIVKMDNTLISKDLMDLNLSTLKKFHWPLKTKHQSRKH